MDSWHFAIHFLCRCRVRCKPPSQQFPFSLNENYFNMTQGTNEAMSWWEWQGRAFHAKRSERAREKTKTSKYSIQFNFLSYELSTTYNSAKLTSNACFFFFDFLFEFLRAKIDSQSKFIIMDCQLTAGPENTWRWTEEWTDGKTRAFHFALWLHFTTRLNSVNKNALRVLRSVPSMRKVRLCCICDKYLLRHQCHNIHKHTHHFHLREFHIFARDISTRSSSSVIRYSAWLQQQTMALAQSCPQTIFPESYSPEDFAGSSDCSAAVSWGVGSSLFLWKLPSPTRILLSMQNIMKRKVLNHLLILETTRRLCYSCLSASKVSKDDDLFKPCSCVCVKSEYNNFRCSPI